MKILTVQLFFLCLPHFSHFRFLMHLATGLLGKTHHRMQIGAHFVRVWSRLANNRHLVDYSANKPELEVFKNNSQPFAISVKEQNEMV